MVEWMMFAKKLLSTERTLRREGKEANTVLAIAFGRRRPFVIPLTLSLFLEEDNARLDMTWTPTQEERLAHENISHHLRIRRGTAYTSDWISSTHHFSRRSRGF